MKRSENAGSSWSSRTIVSFSMTSTLLATRGRRSPDANRLTGQRAFAEEVAGAEHRDDRLFADAGDHRELDRALLDVPDVVAGVALREDDRPPSIPDYLPCRACRFEIRLHIEPAAAFRFDGSCL